MNRIKFTIAICVFVMALISVGLAGDESGEKKVTRDRRIWVAKCLKDFHAIKVGMTRNKIEKRLQLDGGLQGVSPVRFTHPECRYFKIDVEFSFKRNPEDMNRAITSPDDRVTKVSKPYIEVPYSD